MKNAGYSPNPLWKKLGFKPGLTVFVENAPADYRRSLGPSVPENIHWIERLKPGVPLIHAFVREAEELRQRIPRYRKSIAPDGSIWISWPKKSSKMGSDITEQTIRDMALPTGLVDIKVCAVDETWSGLKLVVRKQLR